VVLPPAVHEAILAHARDEAPIECCGMVGHRDGRAVRAVRVPNAAHSRSRFQMDGPEQLRAWQELEDEGLDVAIYHSHTMSAPYPSETDRNFARLWPGTLWLIAGTQEPEHVRGYWIDDGEVREEELDTG
jgi:[CysO sulfur-carrier protein]-S-L-cysteine hydrolase